MRSLGPGQLGPPFSPPGSKPRDAAPRCRPTPPPEHAATHCPPPCSAPAGFPSCTAERAEGSRLVEAETGHAWRKSPGFWGRAGALGGPCTKPAAALPTLARFPGNPVPRPPIPRRDPGSAESTLAPEPPSPWQLERSPRRRGSTASRLALRRERG